jgi:hypothetical protein
MSRGLGGLQRQILESLDAAREAQESYDRGWVLYQRVDMHLIEGVYDLRCVSTYVARQRRYTPYEREAFYPRFSRAVHGLVQREFLTPLTTVPLDEVKFRTGAGDFHPFLSWGAERPYFGPTGGNVR